MNVGMVAATTAGILIDACVRRGLDRKELQAGIPCNLLDHPSGCVPVEAMYVLWDRVIRLTGDPLFAVHTAEQIPFGVYRLLDYMLAASSTPREALARSSQSFGLMNTAFTLSMRSCRDMTYLELSNSSGQQQLPRPYVEYIFINYLVRLRFATQARLNPAEVHVTHAKLTLEHEYSRVFGAPVRFCQAINRMVFDHSSMDIPHRFADAELCEVLEGHAKRKLTGAGGGKNLLAEIQRALGESLETGAITLASLSRQLARSSRSLQREILSQGTSFRELLERVRESRARSLLKDKDLPISEVAWRLRYSDASSFCHAFQRWTGKSPREYREGFD